MVSIVVPTYGRTNTLQRAINSALRQTYTNIEIIVVDDNNDVNFTKAVIDIINKADDPRIVYIKNKTNLGGALSRNVGIKRSKGNYICFLDDDDEYLPEKIDEQLALFKQSKDNKLALVYCYCKGINDINNKVTMYRYNFVGRCLYIAMCDCIAATSQWMCLKEAIQNVGCFSDVPCKQDSNLILKLLIFGYSVNRVPKILSIYHEHNGKRISTSSEPFTHIKGEENLWDLCKNNYDKLTPLEIKMVDYNFAYRLLPYYIKTKNKKRTKEMLRLIIKVPRWRTVRSFSLYIRSLLF